MIFCKYTGLNYYICLIQWVSILGTSIACSQLLYTFCTHLHNFCTIVYTSRHNNSFLAWPPVLFILNSNYPSKFTIIFLCIYIYTLYIYLNYCHRVNFKNWVHLRRKNNWNMQEMCRICYILYRRQLKNVGSCVVLTQAQCQYGYGDNSCILYR